MLAQRTRYTVRGDDDVGIRDFHPAGYVGVEADVDTEGGGALSQDAERGCARDSVAASSVLDVFTFASRTIPRHLYAALLDPCSSDLVG